LEKYIDVIKRIVELSETMEEGLIHIRNQVNEGYFEFSVPLVTDVISAFASIEKSLWTSVDNVSNAELVNPFQNLQNSFNILTEAYEQGSGGRALEILHFNVLPTTKKWKAALEKSFEPYLVS
jgi:hypothetical protein